MSPPLRENLQPSALRPVPSTIPVFWRLWLHSLLRGLVGWTCRPRDRRPNYDEFSNHMLRDIGIDPAAARSESSAGFWRLR